MIAPFIRACSLLMLAALPVLFAGALPATEYNLVTRNGRVMNPANGPE